jgi:hypothetical protein
MRKQQLNVPAGFLSYARSRTLGSAQPVAALDGRVKAIHKPLVDLQVKKTASARKRLPFAVCRLLIARTNRWRSFTNLAFR